MQVMFHFLIELTYVVISSLLVSSCCSLSGDMWRPESHGPVPPRLVKVTGRHWAALLGTTSCVGLYRKDVHSTCAAAERYNPIANTTYEYFFKNLYFEVFTILYLTFIIVIIKKNSNLTSKLLIFYTIVLIFNMVKVNVNS